MNPSGTILIVHGGQPGDEPLVPLLTDQGYDLQLADNGPQALAKAKALTPDLILLGATPDGFETCRELRSVPRLTQVPILMALAAGDHDSRLQGLEVGVDDFVFRPLDRIELQARVRALIRLNRYRRLYPEKMPHRQVESATRQREEYLLAAAACAPLILFALDGKGVVTFLEGQGMDVLGLDRRELIGRPIFGSDFSLGPTLEKGLQLALRGAASSSRLELAGRVFEVRCSPLGNQDRDVSGVVGVVNDITEQARTEIELVKRNHQLLTLQSAGAAVTSSLDLQYVLGSVTRQMAGLLGMKACTLLKWNHANHTVSPLAGHGPDGWWTQRRSTQVRHVTDFPLTEQVLTEQHAQQISIDEPDIAPDEQAYMRCAEIQTVLMLPMVYQDRVIGLVEVMDHREDHTLTAEEISLAQFLANQAASAIENARLYDAIRRHVAEVTALHKISQVITSILDLGETLAIIADHAHWLLDVAAASVILLDEESGDLWFGAASGEGSDYVRGKRLPKGLGIVNWVIQHGEPLIVAEAAKDHRFFDEWDKATGFTTRSILCVPLKAKGHIIGAIEAINKASGPFDLGDLNLLTSMAASAAIAIENARLYERAQRELAERMRVEAKQRKVNQALRTLGECHETLVHAAREEELLRDVCRSLVEVGGHRMAWVGFAEHNDEKTVRVMAQAGDDDGYLAAANITWADSTGARSPTGVAICTRSPCLVRDVRADPRFASWFAKYGRQRAGSSVALPLVAGDQVLGALTIHAHHTDAFDTEEVELLKQLANDLAFGIIALRTRNERDRAEEEIRRLYQELQDHATTLEEVVAKRTQELRAERDRTQAILEAVGEAVIVTDLEGAIQYLNPAAVVLTGYTLKEAVGRSHRLWQDDQSSEARFAQEPGGVDRVQTRRADVVSRRRDGTLYDAAMTVAPLFDSHKPDQLIGHVCVQRDITPIKEAERLKDRFVSNVSHELRTPLSVIALVSGNLDRLYERLADEKRRKMIRDIREHAQVLNDLIGDVLEISRIESGRISMERQRIDLAQLVREEVGKQLALADKKSQRLLVTGTDHLAISANDEQLRQVIRNLLNNAIKYTPSRGQITCECTEVVGKISEGAWPGHASLAPGRWAAMRVVDTGLGIAPEHLPHVFERFYRVKTQGSIPGTGLGLSITKELIESHGGHIAAASALGQGSVFAIYLPLLEE
jgi:PAS domain S-box-containing protein